MGRGIYGQLYRKILVVPYLPVKVNPVIRIKIDKRRKVRPVEDLRVFNTMTRPYDCDSDDYLIYKSDGSHCCHNNEKSQCNYIHSDTETESSITSLIMNPGNDSYLLLEIYDTSDDDQAPPIVQRVIPFISNGNSDLCPLHGLPSVPPVPDLINPMRVENEENNMNGMNEEVTSLCDIVKTYMLSEDYPPEISLEMINRFCNVPIKRLVVDINVPEWVKPVEDYKLKHCEIKLIQLKIATITDNSNSNDDHISVDNPPTPNQSETDTNELPASPQGTEIQNVRPKRKINKPVNYTEDPGTDDNVEDIVSSPRPRRTQSSLSNPSSSQIAAQKPRSTKGKPVTPVPHQKHESDKHKSKPVKFIAPKDRLRNTRAKRKVKPKSATPAKPALPKPGTSPSTDDKTDLKH